jgi:hypothetical protein
VDGLKRTHECSNRQVDPTLVAIASNSVLHVRGSAPVRSVNQTQRWSWECYIKDLTVISSFIIVSLQVRRNIIRRGCSGFRSRRKITRYCLVKHKIVDDYCEIDIARDE